MRTCQKKWCRNFDTLCLGRAASFAALLLAFALPAIAFAKDKDDSTLSRLLKDAGKAQVEGNAGLSYSLLHQAARLAPDNSQVRWQLGQVKVGDEWLSVEEAERRAANDPRQVNFANRNKAFDNSPAGQLALARWCRKSGLDDEARFYWASVLQYDPSNVEALRAVKLRWHGGELVSPGQLQETRRDSSAAALAQRRWASRISDWLRALSDPRELSPAVIVDAIRSVHDPAVIPAFERITLDEGLTANEKSPGPRRLSIAFVGTLSQMPEDAATKSLARHAVMSQFDDVQAESTAELRNRSMHDYVPMLLDGLAAPIQTAYQVVNDADGSVHYLHRVYREGPFADWSYNTTRSIYQSALSPRSSTNILASFSGPTISNASNASRLVTSVAALRSARNYEREIYLSEMQVQQSNERTAALNDRIATVLASTTGQSLGNDPRAWWNWWQDYTDYYRTTERPVYEAREASSEVIRRPDDPPTHCECFVLGTPVWTKTGQRPIESLELGDLVLSQNVDTGELSYKPVLRRTQRPPGPTVKLTIGEDQLRSTRGHLYWVTGLGWRMAKELENDAQLHAVTGVVPLRATEATDEAETFNLVVADFNTYFVGEGGVLVHDNTPRTPTRAVVPGLPTD